MEKKKTSAGCLPGKPCFPWVGGKRRLLPVLIQSLPENITEMETYVEPFVGGGALFFWLRQTYPHIRCVINDSNESLVNVYRVIRDTPEELVGLLAGIQGEYHALEELTERRDYFMESEGYSTRSTRMTSPVPPFSFSSCAPAITASIRSTARAGSR